MTHKRSSVINLTTFSYKDDKLECLAMAQILFSTQSNICKCGKDFSQHFITVGPINLECLSPTSLSGQTLCNTTAYWNRL